MSKLRVILILASLAVIGMLAFLTLRGDFRLHSKARRDWKNQAIATIGRRLADSAWIATEAERLREHKPGQYAKTGQWMGDDLLVMQSGDWIICQSVCAKEPAGIHDLFIGHGSDGKWYYSTFHFCVGRCVLDMEEQPENLRAFIDTYWLAGFDGRSNDCLMATWPDARPAR